MKSYLLRIPKWIILSLVLITFVYVQQSAYVPRKEIPILENINNCRVAICLVGEARHLELTGPTIRKHLLNPLKSASIFINMHIDRDSYKIVALEGDYNFTYATLSYPRHIREDRIYTQTLSAKTSPRGIQGLLQYFDLVEGCERMIRKQEQLQGYGFDWIIRTRLDTFWSDPIRTLYIKGAYTVPFGTRYGGYNDRLGVGERDLSRYAFSRLNALEMIHIAGYERENSEEAYKAQIQLQHVNVIEEPFPFCILSNRSFNFPPGKEGALVTSIGSKGPLNGAYCRPCEPVISGKEARRMVNRMVGGWIPTQGLDLEICDASGMDWDKSWPAIFDDIAGQQAADERREIMNMTNEECVSKLSQFQQKWSTWDGPDAPKICKNNLF